MGTCSADSEDTGTAMEHVISVSLRPGDARLESYMSAFSALGLNVKFIDGSSS